MSRSYLIGNRDPMYFRQYTMLLAMNAFVELFHTILCSFRNFADMF